MSALSSYRITKKWPAIHPERIQLYSLPTPNGVKASIMLEETGLPYEPHLVDFDTHDQKSPEYLSLNPAGKIPAIIDPVGDAGKPLALTESGAILIYLAEKSGKFYSAEPQQRYETLKWLMFQMASVGPMFGQVGYFVKYEGRDLPDKRPRDHYLEQSRNVLSLLDARLADREWLVDEYSVADIATFPWVRNLIGHYGAGELVGIENFSHVQRALARFLERPAVQRGLKVPARPG
ncbi:MAG TPA: glutathione S-transferase N-terminal domain-containing protein [Polyangiales bacterium]|nr:glutathione S-transferase N-terminal domain-containing protein [Polyangiales bacterium]